MAEETLDAYLFEGGNFLPHRGNWGDGLEWSDYLAREGYAEQEQTWGSYPDVYVKVYEAPPNAKAAFPFVAIINLVYVPHRVFVRSLGDLIQLLNMLMPLFEHHSRPDQEVGDALVGTNDAGD